MIDGKNMDCDKHGPGNNRKTETRKNVALVKQKMDFVKHRCSKNRVAKQICNCMSEAFNSKTWSLKSGLCKRTLVKR